MNPLLFLGLMVIISLLLCSAVGALMVLTSEGEFDHDSVQLHESEGVDLRGSE